MNSLTFICILFAGISHAAVITTPFPNVYKNITVEEHKTFISYYLMKAYYQTHPQMAYVLNELNLDPDVIKKMESIETPANFAVNLYQWTVKYYNLSDEQMLRLARGELICIPPEMVECVDSGDSGSICCT